MFTALGLGVALASLAQVSAAGQSSMVSSNYYRIISIDASSWSDIATFTMANSGLSRQIINHFSFSSLQKKYFISQIS